MWCNFAQEQSDIVAMRRDLHQIPELGDDLPQTSAYVKQKLSQWGISYCCDQFESSIIADICGRAEGKTLALRADMDALPIKEQTNLPYSSKTEGRMHACGHDAHTAMLLTTAKVLQENRDQFTGKIRLIFQSGEETGTGAKNMIKGGAMNGVDAIVSIHIGTLGGKTVPSGKAVIVPGNCTATKDKFTLTINGKGCHGAHPQEGVDPITVASHIVIALQELFARELTAGSSAVLTIGSFQSGSGHNAIPSTAVLKGSIRTKDKDVRALLLQRTEEISNGIANAFRASAMLELTSGSMPVYNDPDLTKLVTEAASKAIGSTSVQSYAEDTLMSSDDFANYAQMHPAVYIFLSSANPQKHTDFDLHSPFFDIDEDVLWEGPAIFCAVAEAFLR